MPLTVSGGVAEALDGDSHESLLARADAALYGAKSAGRNCIFRHTGDGAELVAAEAAGAVEQAATASAGPATEPGNPKSEVRKSETNQKHEKPMIKTRRSRTF